MLMAFIHGCIMGFAIAAVIGPIGILCLRKSFTVGFGAGIAVGIGASLADMLFGAVAFIGLSSVSSFLLQYADVLRIVGGAFLVYLGYQSYKSRPESITIHEGRHVDGVCQIDNTYSPMVEIIMSFVLTLTSPVTILTFIGFCSAFGIESLPFSAALLATVGVFVGSMVWWVLLTSFGVFVRERAGASVIKIINMVSGLMIALFGIVSIVYGIKNLF